MKMPDRRITRGYASDLIHRNYFHFNAGVLKRATEAYAQHINNGGYMMLAMAGAASTAEIGISLGEMIRQDKIHCISCTGANLEEDVFNLVAHDAYEQINDYQDLAPEDEMRLMEKHLNRVTDVAIPEQEAMTPIETAITDLWKKESEAGNSRFPFEYLYELLNKGKFKKYYQIDPKNSWMLAAAEKNLPIVTPGWEDSTLGQVFSAMCKKGDLDYSCVKYGPEAYGFLIDWYMKESKKHPMGFFQLGGGIAGDYSICVVPLIEQDMKEKNTRKLDYFCQIRSGQTSNGNYSDAPGREKITWGKTTPKTKMFDIVSDFTICAPLMFDAILGL
jgi:deoxyhypusine synthase